MNVNMHLKAVFSSLVQLCSGCAMGWVSFATAAKSRLWLYRYPIQAVSLLSPLLQVWAPLIGRLTRVVPSPDLAAVLRPHTSLAPHLKVLAIKSPLSCRP